jgi:microcystin degradation protein MlrC
LESSASWELKTRLKSIEVQPNVLAACIATVQPWLDIPEFGSAVVVVTDGNAAQAEDHANELAHMLWQRREAYLPQLVPVEQAVCEAHGVQEGLVVLGDGADATTSGAPGDNTSILAELLKYQWRGPVLVTLVGAEIVRAAEQLGVGAMIDTQVGGKRDCRFGRSISIQGTIERLFDARFVISGHLARNLSIDMGRSVVLRLDEVRLVVTTRSGPHFSPELFRAAGIDPFAAAVLVAKSPCGFRAAYQSRAAKILHVASPGCAPSDFWNYDYHNIPRPLWPWDRIDDWKLVPTSDR